ncbi:MAG: SUMF1/EgtB/PvdO family nonheme iron enzyme [Myxococcota bacterium]|nr:SUMF1/EgtB/PvdO family nonheme iron enzyme [Myxococcota bacterium]
MPLRKIEIAVVGILFFVVMDFACNTDTATEVRWIEIQGGAYQMGSEDVTSEQEPIHDVTIQDFAMTKTEITVGQYAACVEADVCSYPGLSWFCNWRDIIYEHHPINCVDWDQALSFCDWIGGRLPTEAEWEYAARSGGKEQLFPWGNKEPSCDYAIMDSTGEGCERIHTWPVCSKTAGNSDQGLCDLSGNVLEWVADCWHSNYNDAPDNGSAWTEECDSNGRVLRGGGWTSRTGETLSATFRTSDDQSDKRYYSGFRCARDGDS